MGNVCWATKVAGRGEPGVLPDDAHLTSRSAGNFTLPETNSDTCGRDIVAPSTTSAPPPSRSGLVSAGIQRMLASRSEFDSVLDFRATHSKVHWSELSDEGASNPSLVDHRQHFQSLQKEILRQLKDRTSSSQVPWCSTRRWMCTASYAMTCYEIASGLLPFEGLPFSEMRDRNSPGSSARTAAGFGPGDQRGHHFVLESGSCSQA